MTETPARQHLNTNRPPFHAVGVCGFGRCGSTMVMSMLVAGGCPPGNSDSPPYEGDPDTLHGRDLAGTCVKLLDPAEATRVLAGPTGGWRFVWLDRDSVEQAKSMVKFLRVMAPVTGAGPTGPDEHTILRLSLSYARDRPRMLGTLRRAGKVLVLDYERVLTQPRKAAKMLRRDVWPWLDVDAAAAVVHARDGRCAPDLAAEISMRGGAS